MSVHIRPLLPDEWELFRDIRIRAVEQHTGYFFADPIETRKRPKEFWINTLIADDNQVSGLFNCDQIIGLCGVFTWNEDPSGKTGVMAMDFIEAEYRGKGYASLLYDARIKFAIEYKAWDRLSIGHRKGNEPSRRAMIKHGFKLIETKDVEWPDGAHDIEYIYELDLSTLRNAQEKSLAFEGSAFCRKISCVVIF